MVKKIVALLFAGFMVSSVASAELPVIVDIKPKEINKDPVVREYASALWESFNWDSSDTTFATVVSGEGMRRIVVQVDAVTVPQAEGSKEDVQFARSMIEEQYDAMENGVLKDMLSIDSIGWDELESHFNDEENED